MLLVDGLICVSMTATAGAVTAAMGLFAEFSIRTLTNQLHPPHHEKDEANIELSSSPPRTMEEDINVKRLRCSPDYDEQSSPPRTMEEDINSKQLHCSPDDDEQSSPVSNAEEEEDCGPKPRYSMHDLITLHKRMYSPDGHVGRVHKIRRSIKTPHQVEYQIKFALGGRAKWVKEDEISHRGF